MDLKAQLIVPPVFLVVATLCAYRNSLSGGFTFDDSSAIIDNADLRPNTPITNLLRNDFWGMPLSKEESHKSYRPITVLSFRLNYLVHGLDPFGYHLVNLVLHVIVSLLFHGTLRKVLHFAQLPAFQAALLFALHPIHTEAVAGVVGRAELLSALFSLAALLTRSDKKSSPQQNLLSVAAAFSATFCKEQGLTVLGLCVSHELFFQRGPSKTNDTSKIKILMREIWRKKASLAFLSIGTVFILSTRVVALKGGLPRFTEFDNPASALGSRDRQLTYNYLLALNAWLLTCPHWLCADWTMGTLKTIHGLWDPRNAATVFFYAILFRLGLKCWRNQSMSEGKFLLFCLSWIVFPFIPSSNLLFPVGFVVAERVLYIPSMGFCALVAFGFSKILIRLSYSKQLQKALHILFAFLCVTFGAKTFVRCADWEDDWTLFRSALKVTMNNAKVFNNLGHYLEHQSAYSEALGYFLKATEVQPNDVGAWVNVGRTYVNLGSKEEAETAFITAKSLMPRVIPGRSYTAHLAPSSLKIFINLGNLYKNTSRLKKAADQYLEAIQLLPSFVAAYQNLGDVYMAQGKLLEAKGVFLQGLQHSPESFELRYNLGILEAQRGRKKEALGEFDEALRIRPDHFESLLNSAYILSEFPEQKQSAIERARKATLVRPDMDSLHRLLGTLLYEAGFRSEALDSFRTSTRLNPLSKSGFLNLGLIYADLGNRNEARKAYKVAIDLDPSDNRARLPLCELLVNSFNDPVQGRKCYEEALKREPLSVQARHNLCVLLMDMRMSGEARTCINEAELLLSQSKAYSLQHLNVLKTRFNSLVH